ncbi:TB2/DP1, HVA22 family domain-containing protein [Ditylenchus destructor]|nr:TB2/DP1, HVA22 family domain-containing protein [Ditylenchus destructor]
MHRSISLGDIPYVTWKTLQSRKTRPLVPHAKYWTVFGLMTLIEWFANLLYLPQFLPGYSLMKFTAVVYVSQGGYERIFRDIVNPFLKDYEPTGERILNAAKQVGPRVVTSAVNVIVDQMVASLNRPRMVENNGDAQPDDLNVSVNRRRSSVRIMEVQEESDDEIVLED